MGTCSQNSFQVKDHPRKYRNHRSLRKVWGDSTSVHAEWVNKSRCLSGHALPLPFLAGPQWSRPWEEWWLKPKVAATFSPWRTVLVPVIFSLWGHLGSPHCALLEKSLGPSPVSFALISPEPPSASGRERTRWAKSTGCLYVSLKRS